MTAAAWSLPIEVTETQPPSMAVMVLTQPVEVGPPDWDYPVKVLVGIRPDGTIEALRGVPSWTPAPPAVPFGFTPLAIVHLERGQAAIANRSIELC